MELQKLLERCNQSKSERIKNALELLDIALTMTPEEQAICKGIIVGITASREVIGKGA